MQSFQLSTTAYIHEGKAFEYSGRGTIAANSSITFIGNIGALPVHFHGFAVKVNKGPVLLEFIEAPSISVLGSEVIPFNKNRKILDKSDMKIYSGGTVTGGTVLDPIDIFDIGGGSHTEGGDGGVTIEWILKPNSTYAFKISNLDTNASCNFNAKFFYYEVEV